MFKGSRSDDLQCVAEVIWLTADFMQVVSLLFTFSATPRDCVSLCRKAVGNGAIVTECELHAATVFTHHW